MPSLLRSFLPLLFLCLAAAASAQVPCRRGFAVPEPFVVNSDFRLRSTFSDLDGDRRPDTILQGDAEDYLFLNRGDVHPLVSVSGHVARESLIAVHDQNGDGKRDFIYKESSSWLVAFGNGDGTGGTIVQSFPGPLSGHPVPTDVDRDGRLDFVAVGEKELQFLRGTGDGRFAAAGTHPIQRPSDRRPFVTGDFDGDGSLDVATFADTEPLILKMIRIFWTSHSFEVSGPSMNQAPMPETLVAADLEGDGTEEIIGFLDGRLVVIRGTDRIVRTETVELPPDAGSGSLTPVGITDFDGDGRRDLIAAGGNGSVLVFRGTANGTWRSPDLYAMNGDCPRILDLDADGRDDVVSGCGSLGVLYGGGRPSSALPGFRTAGVPRDVAVTDQNRDGIADLVVTTETGIELKLGAGKGTFSATSWSTAGHAAAIADLDEDEVPDLVVSVGETNKVFFGTANGFSADFVTLPNGQVLGAWTVEGKSVVVILDGHALQTVAISPGHETTLTPLPPIPAEGPAVLIQADGDPDFEVIFRPFQDFPRVWQRSGDEWDSGGICT